MSFLIGLVVRLFGVFVVFFAPTLPLFYTGNFFVGFSDILFQTAFFYAVEIAPKSMGETLPQLFRITDSTFEVFSPALLWLTLDNNRFRRSCYCIYSRVSSLLAQETQS